MEAKRVKIDHSVQLGDGGSSSVIQEELEGRQDARRTERVLPHKLNIKGDKLMRKLKHPNIVTLFHGESENDFRYNAATSLDKLFLASDDPDKYKGPMPHHIEVFLQLASGLEYIHSMNLVHRNIKPKNIVLPVRSSDQHEEVMIKWANFGLSENEDGTWMSNAIKGNTDWLAPELLKLPSNREEKLNREASVKSDVFAQGLVFGYLLLNGQHLYGSTEIQDEIMNNIIERNPTNMQKIGGKLRDLYVDDLLLKMLENDPIKRITSAEVVIQLKSIMEKLAEKEKEFLQLCALDSPLDPIKKIKDLIDFGIDVNTKDSEGRNALHNLCRYNSSAYLIDGIQILINHGIDVKAKTNDGSTALHCLSRYNSSPNVMDAIHLLVESGIKMDSKDNDGFPMLYYCWIKNSNEMKIWVNPKALLGQGAFSQVYKGKFGGREVAVKRVLLQNHNLEEETTIMLQLSHPNIVKLFHFESDDNFRYYALELCNASLDQLFLESDDPKKYKGSMPRPIEVFLQLASGLEHIHSKNLIHRDIKTNNVLILVRPSGSHEEVTIKWADFGLSRTVNERGTYTMSTIKGTHSWFAPEILRLEMQGDECRGTVKSDVFAQGLVFGCLLMNGQHLYGSTRHEIDNNIIEKNPVNLQKIDRQIREFFAEDLLTKMLENDPIQRMSSCEVVIQLISIKEKFAKNEEELRQLCARDSQLELTETIKNFVGLGIDVDARDNNGRNALHFLCLINSSLNLNDAIKKLIQSGIDVSAKDNDGWNALHFLCRNKSSLNLKDAIEMLIQSGIDVNAKDNIGWNALHFLCRNKSSLNLKDAIEMLIQCGIDVNAKNNNGWNALHVLCLSNSSLNLKDAIEMLIQSGIDVNAKDNIGWNALHFLCRNKSSLNLKDAIEMLIQCGIDVNAKNNNGWNALHVLCLSNSSLNLKDAIEMLIQSGIDVNAKDNIGWNALHFLCRNKSSLNLKDAIEMLIQCGIDVNAKNNDGWNALHFLCENNSSLNLKDAIEMLIQSGIDVNAKDVERLNSLKLVKT